MTNPPELPVEILKAKIVDTDTGYPASLQAATDAYGRSVRRAPEAGWFWVSVSPSTAKRMRRDGHRAVGTMLTTWFPPQSAPEVEDVPEPEGRYQPMYDDNDNIIGLIP